MQSSFQRQSVAAQAAASLENELLQEKWRDHLPSERELSAKLGISRGVLRSALFILRKKGLLRTLPRCATVIIPHKFKRHGNRPPKIVGLLLSEHLNTFSFYAHNLIHQVEHELHASGYELAVQPVLHQGGRNLAGRLEEVVAGVHAASWLLCAASLEAQTWFMRRKIPTLLLGACFPGVCLPEMDVDYRAICRHAVETLRRLGHRRILLLTLKKKCAGDLRGEQGFYEAFKADATKGAAGQILPHNGSLRDIQRVVDSALAGNEAPTAIIECHSYYALMLTGYLIHKGIRVPGDISVICRDDDDFLNWSFPPIAHYAADIALRARRIARAIVRLDVTGRLPARMALIFPRFVPGGTVAPPP